MPLLSPEMMQQLLQRGEGQAVTPEISFALGPDLPDTSGAVDPRVAGFGSEVSARGAHRQARGAHRQANVGESRMPAAEAPINWGATTGPGSSLPPAPGYDVGRGITTPNLEDALRMRQFYARERLDAPSWDVSAGGMRAVPMRGGMPVPEDPASITGYRPYTQPAPFPMPESEAAERARTERAARVEELIRQMQEEEALRARLRALGR
jgi:hypothetical protein